jgi:serine/threonine protein kinase
MRDLKSGTQLASRYTLVRKLGAGGAAETWLASDKLTRASVALKILVDESIPAATLRREWQLSIRLVHAHIARVFEFHDAEDGQHNAFYSMQYIDGPDLTALSGAPLADILAPVGLLTDALRYAHEKGVLHRDVKPANVLLDGNGAPYLIDFGIAAAGDDHIGGGSVIASSPQQLDGNPPAASDDIFALGGLIYELVSAGSPYSSSSTEDDIRNKIPPPLTAADGSSVSLPLQELLAKMLDKDASNRPDAAGVSTALKSAGFHPGPAPAAYVGEVRAVRDEVVKSEAAIQRTQRQRATTAKTSSEEPGGVTPRGLGISLAVLMLILLSVIFLLPKTVTNNNQPTTADRTTQDTSQATTDEDQDQALPDRDVRVQEREATDASLGRLLSRMRTLEGRAVQRWGGLPFRRAEDAYKAGDAAYLEKDFARAGDHYREALDVLEPLLDQVDVVFNTTLNDAEQALGNGDTAEALRLYELAVAISPSHGPARRGLFRAKNLDEVLSLTEQGLILERDLELDAALQNFEMAIELDPEWEVAKTGRSRVLQTVNELEFQQRMTEGLTSLYESDYLGARAAFRMAQELQPGSPEPADGLQQVDQGIRLGNISALEQEAAAREDSEKWQESADAYSRILELDSDLSFAQDGLTRSREMIALHEQLDKYIESPDSLSSPRTMQSATNMVVNITRMPEIGSQLAKQRDELSRLLKRAATPLTVQIVSDNLTDVSIYKVGKLGSFSATELTLRPGTYVAVGSRPGYRDVRVEFHVSPEEDMQPVVVRCEERI